MSRGPHATDEQILRVLELRDEGLSFSAIARVTKLTRNTVLGIWHRVTDAAGPPDEFDGTMPYGWWNIGLRKRNVDRGDA